MTVAPQIIHAKIGEVKIGRSPDILKATLGSCVGIAFLWKEKGQFGLAHCLLPESPEYSLSIGAKYVSQAIPSLMSLMHIKDSDMSTVEVQLAGGSNMNDPSNARVVSPHIGEQNISAAKKILIERGFRIARCESGNSCAMQIEVNCGTGLVEIVKIIDSQKIVLRC